jgi:hypothetical protein
VTTKQARIAGVAFSLLVAFQVYRSNVSHESGMRRLREEIAVDTKETILREFPVQLATEFPRRLPSSVSAATIGTGGVIYTAVTALPVGPSYVNVAPQSFDRKFSTPQTITVDITTPQTAWNAILTCNIKFDVKRPDVTAGRLPVGTMTLEPNNHYPCGAEIGTVPPELMESVERGEVSLYLYGGARYEERRDIEIWSNTPCCYYYNGTVKSGELPTCE